MHNRSAEDAPFDRESSCARGSSTLDPSTRCTPNIIAVRAGNDTKMTHGPSQEWQLQVKGRTGS